MSLQVFIDGKTSLVNMTPQQRREAARLAQYQGVLDDFIAQEIRSGKDGRYGYFGEYNSAVGGNVTLPGRSAFDQSLDRHARVARVRERMAKGDPPLSLLYDLATDTEIMAVEDAEAYEEGWICPNCMQYQGVVAPECNWRNAPHQDIKGCGFRRDSVIGM